MKQTDDLNNAERGENDIENPGSQSEHHSSSQTPGSVEPHVDAHERAALASIEPPSISRALLSWLEKVQALLLSTLALVYYALSVAIFPIIMLVPSSVHARVGKLLFNFGYLVYTSRAGLFIHKRIAAFARYQAPHSRIGDARMYSTCAVLPVPMLFDNIAYILLDHESYSAAIVDPCDASPLLQVVHAYGYRVDALLVTHFHHDHAGGLDDVLKKYPQARVIAAHGEPVVEATERLCDGSECDVSNIRLKAIVTSGHSHAHCSFALMPRETHSQSNLHNRSAAMSSTTSALHAEAVFSGDAVFIGGVGANFHGSSQDIAECINKFISLPDHCELLCGHEYTVSTLRFRYAPNSSSWLNVLHRVIHKILLTRYPEKS